MLMQKVLSFTISLFLFGICGAESATIKGAVLLDEYNFDRVIKRFDTVLVKFDAVYPFGDKHEAFKTVTEELKDSDDLLIATVGIQDFSEHDNQKLAERFGIMTKKDWPALRLFIKGEDEPFSYNNNNVWNVNDIKKFIKEHSNVYLGLAGCLEKFDKLALEFAVSSRKENLIKKAEAELNILENEVDKKSAEIYIKFMKKALEKESFIEDERKRLSKILKEGKIKSDKKENMQLRANILTSFIPIKTEL